MKRFVYFMAFCISQFWGINNCFAQTKMVAKTYDKFVKEYQINNEKGPDKAVIIRHDTMVHPFAIASNYFVKQRIFPNEDAVRLIQELNPKIDMSAEAKVIQGDTRLILPNYPPPNDNVLMQFKVEYLKDATPDEDLNQRFKKSSEIFNQIFQGLPVPDDEAGKKFYDSLTFFNKTILPYINNSAQSISRLQMHYFNTELTALNQSFQTKLRRIPTKAIVRKAADDHMTASYIIADFYEIANPVQIRRSLYTERRNGGNSIEDKKDPGFIFLDDLKARPFACNLYIYGKDEQGNRKTDPEMFTYDVWVGDKMSFTLRRNGNAPESYGFLKMGNPASTLPFNIGLGKWIVIMRRQGTSIEYYKEISIYSETGFEPDDPNARKVCYVLD